MQANQLVKEVALLKDPCVEAALVLQNPIFVAGTELHGPVACSKNRAGFRSAQAVEDKW